MDAIDVVSHINEIIHCNIADEDKVNMIKEELSEYFNELNEEKGEE